MQCLPEWICKSDFRRSYIKFVDNINYCRVVRKPPPDTKPDMYWCRSVKEEWKHTLLICKQASSSLPQCSPTRILYYYSWGYLGSWIWMNLEETWEIEEPNIHAAWNYSGTNFKFIDLKWCRSEFLSLTGVWWQSITLLCKI